jgi:hypothetical protein
MSAIPGKSRSRRSQVSLRKEEYELAKKLAAAKGISMSRVIGDALRAADTEHTLDDPLAYDERIFNNPSSNRPHAGDEWYG